MKQLLEFEKPVQKLRDELEALRAKATSKPSDKLTSQIADLEVKLDKLQRETHANLNPWQRVQISRHLNRPFMLDYVKHICDEFVELHGDRHIGDDNAMPAGFATIGGQRVAIIGHQKGRDTKENLLRNFGSAHPEGYRKALRVMRMAEKFGLPIVTLIDTPGAFPGIGAEERNIAEAIAFKCSPADYQRLTTEVDGIRPASHNLHKAHWVTLEDPEALTETQLTTQVRAAYDLIRAALPKKLQATLK